MSKKLHVTLVKSPIGYTLRQKKTVRALGLSRMNKTVVLPDTPPMRGMVNAISHLVKVEEVEE
ncbi:50S ribosomal protein L30 [bacterium]|nr:MAG: 50S ribosomal protein L30 [bacterium]